MNKPACLIKICGMKDPELAAKTVHMGAQFIGIIMHPPSVRYVDSKQATIIAKHVKQAGGIPVAVFVEQNAKEMLALCKTTGINSVQLHGDTPRKTQHQLPQSIQRIYVIPVSSDGILLENPPTKILNKQRDLLLFDNTKAGSGKTFNWNQFPYTDDFPFLVAGGLNPDNVQQAISQLKPNGVDCSSGVENSPGVKSEKLIREFIDKVMISNH